MLAKMLIRSEHYRCIDQIMIICAMLSVGNAVFFRPKDKKMHADNAKKTFFRPGGDHLTLLNVYNTWAEFEYSQQWCTDNFIQIRSLRRAREVKEQLAGLLERVEVDVANEELSIYEDDQNTNIRKCIISGFFMNCARNHREEVYKTTKYNMSVRIHPSSMLHKDQPECVVYHELVLTTQEYMRNVIEVEPAWMVEIAPHFYKAEDFISKNNNKKKRPLEV
jgi:pre-mRNA-splicing factor ATP-dependent RNA helicase DHX16